MTFPEVQFNGRCLAQPLTGVQRYVVELSRKLENELFTIRPTQEWAQGLRGHSWEQIYLPRLCDQRLLWSPGNTGPLLCANQVVTIHDASTLDHPEWFERKFAVLYGWLLPKLARRVRAIITVSAFSKERLISRLRVPESKIHVVPNGLSEEFHLQQEPELDAGLREPFFLYVGSLEPRKNLGCLLEAWDHAALKDWRLVIVGERAGIFENVSLKTNSPQVIFTGRLDEPRASQPLSCSSCFRFTFGLRGVWSSPSRGDGLWLPLSYLGYSGSSRGLRDRSDVRSRPLGQQLG